MQPVRKIGISHRALRAAVPSVKAGGRAIQAESALERDFCCLAEFDLQVSTYIEQPVRIEFELAGRRCHYTPDFLVRYTDERPAALVEVKYRGDLRRDWERLKPRFRAAKHYAADHGWQFRIYSEQEIRGTYLNNVQFLLRFRPPRHEAREEYVHLLLEVMAQLDESTPEEVLLVAFQDADRRAELLPTLWALIGTGRIGCNLLLPLTMRTPLWSINAHPLSRLHEYD